MGKVVDTAGLKIVDTVSPPLPRPDAPRPPPAPLTKPAGPVERPKTVAPVRTAAIAAAFGLAMIGGFGLLYAQNLQSGGRVEARMARVDRLDERLDALTAKLDTVAASLDTTGSRLQAMSSKLETVGSQVGTGLRDANRTLSETLNSNFSAFSQRLAAQQQQMQKEQREQREKEQRQSAPPPSSSAPGTFSPYSQAPGSIRQRRPYP